MTLSINKVILIGNVGAPPQVKLSSDGHPMASFSVATSEGWKDKKNGEWREKTEWHRIISFHEPLVKIIEKYVVKGARVYIEGQLQTRKRNKEAENQELITEIILTHTSCLIVLDMKSNPNDIHPASDRWNV